MPCYSSCDILGDTSLSPIEVRVLLISFPPDPAFGQRVNAEDPVSKAHCDAVPGRVQKSRGDDVSLGRSCRCLELLDL